MIARYVGVYWINRKDQLPEEFVLCVFHVKGTKPDTIHYGGYSEKLGFMDQVSKKWYKPAKIDYWMPIPLLSTEEGVK